MPTQKALAVRAYQLGCIAGARPNDKRAQRRALVAMKDLLAAATEDDLRQLSKLTGESIEELRALDALAINEIDRLLVNL